MDSTSKPGTCYRFDDLLIDCASLRVEKRGEPRKITPRAFDVLVYLASQRGRLVEKQELFEQVWKDAFVTDNALTRAVKEIRQVIGDDADSPRYIETVPKRGYRCIADVQITDTKPARIDSAESSPAVAERPAPEPVVVAPTELPHNASLPESIVAEQANRARAGGKASRVKLALAGLASGLIVLAAFVFWLVGGNSAPTEILRTTQVTIYAGLDIDPSLSPDGNSIVYSSDHSGNFEIYVKQLTPGAIERQLTSDGAQNFQPAWSPDGQRIAFYSKNRGGGPITQLTFEKGQSWTHSWSPDGDKIAFAGFRNGTWNIWWVSRSTKQQKRLTAYTKLNSFVRYPAWSPLGNQIVYKYTETTGNIWLMELK